VHRETIRRVPALAVLSIASLLGLSSAPGGAFPQDPAGGAIGSAAGDESARRPPSQLPEDDPAFISLMERVEERAGLYRKYALGFTCREIVRASRYDVNAESYKKNQRTVYDYLFEEKPGGGLREVREEVIETKAGVKHKSTDFEAPVPPAYSWATLFGPENRGKFHFRPAGQIVKAYRLLVLIDFVGISPNPGGGDIAGWSGQVALDSRSLNLWSVEAQPSGQEQRLQAEIRKYQKAFAIAGVPLASRPHGWKLSVTFGMDLNGLSYPTEQSLSMTSLSSGGKMNLDSKTVFRYEEYRFFKVATEEELKRTGDTPPP